jgi:hypothetical protein
LSEYGFAVIDFLNVKVLKHLFGRNKTVEELIFIWNGIKDGHIYKEIDFEDKGQKFHFTEK